MLSHISKIGPIMQMAYVPSDFDAAVKFWTETMGVGPFFYIPHSGLQDTLFRGAPTDLDFGLALAYWGDIQIELIKVHNDAPSMFKEWRSAGKEGVHHLCVLTEDMSQARAICAEAGFTVLQEAEVPGGGKVVYMDTGGGDGTIVEILQPAPGSDMFFDMMRQAAVDWDGSEPFRTIG